MRIGELDRVMELQQRQTTLDAEGSPNELWSTNARIRANVEPLSATEQLLALQAGETITHQVTVRWRRELATPPLPGGPQGGHNLRLLMDMDQPGQPPRVFDIRGVVIVGEERRWLRLVCLELQTT